MRVAATSAACVGCRNAAAALWEAAARVAPPQFDWRTIYGSRHPMLFDSASLVRFLEVRRAGEGFAEAMPAGLGTWAMVVAVRAGAPAWWHMRDDWTYRPDDPEDAMRQMHRLPPGWVTAMRPPLHGPDVVDLVVCRLSLRGEPMRLSGVARCMGEDPADNWEATAEGPVRVHASVSGWLANECGGIVPLGTPQEQQALLRDLTGGIIADSVAHGEALKRLMKRDLPAPPAIYVQQREAA